MGAFRIQGAAPFLTLALMAGGVACSDGGVKSYNTDPEIAIVTGPGGATFGPLSTFTVTALATDQEDPPDQLEVFVSLDGAALPELTPDGDGEVDLEVDCASLDSGGHTLVLTVVDTDGASGSDSDTFAVDVARGPAGEITAPAAGDEGCAGAELALAGLAQDPDDDEEELLGRWLSDLDGQLEAGIPVESDGSLETTAALTTAGAHVLTLVVVDPLGLEGQDEVSIEVLSAEDCGNHAPQVVIDAPTDGQTHLEGNCVPFLGTATDTEDAAPDLSVTWISDLDGLLDSTPPDAAGELVFPACSLSVGEHTVVLRAEDSEGASGTDEVTFEVCPDADGDGYTPCFDDCDDGDPAVYPGAAELCNGVDDDCDGVIPADELDGDGDGYAPCDGDCDDGDPSVYPGAPEPCDGVDHDCDGLASYDSDNDGVCDGDDICPGHDDNADADGDGIPDGCDLAAGQIPLSGDQTDHDVAADGALATLRASGGQILVTCYEPDRTLRKAEFAVGSYVTTNAAGVFMSREAHHVMAVWRDNDNVSSLESLKYAYLDDACDVLVPETVVWGPDSGYYEFFDAALDDDGAGAIVYSNGATEIAWIDDVGSLSGTEQVMDIGAYYGTHVALNQAQGTGIVMAQIHSGDGLYYRRFSMPGSWTDWTAVQIPVNYHYWYDGYTVGMNDNGHFVVLWRSHGTQIDMKFFDNWAVEVAYVTRSTPDFEGWNGGHCYDSFRRRHQEIPLRGDNFVLGEVYNWIAGDNLSVQHFEYTPSGSLVSQDATTYSCDEGLTIRLDELNVAYLRDESTLYMVPGYP